MTIAVLALDAADYRLARTWGCDNILLDDARPLETMAYALDLPYTPEAWATVATGVHPRVHGVGDSAYEWDNPLLRAASHVTRHLPHRTRRWLGTVITGSRGAKADAMSFNTTDHSHVFKDGLVKGWPGITPAHNLSAAWADIGRVAEGELTHQAFRERLLTRTGEELGWLKAASQLDVPIAGIHSHVLDAAGHAYADDEARLQAFYREVDEMVGELRQSVGELLVLSDHGMQVSFLGDARVGKHSWQALIASQGLPGVLPESILDVRAWLEDRIESGAVVETEPATMATPTEHLRALGYVE